MGAQAEARVLFSGASVDVTPDPGKPLAGYVARGDAVATGTLDPLEATLVRVRDPRPGGGVVTWVAIDALAVDVELAEQIEATVAAATGDRLGSAVVCASHTHSGPSGWLRGIPVASPNEGDPAMRAELVERIAQAAASLKAGEVPVRPFLAVGEVDGIGTNRSDPGGPTDRSVGVLSFVDTAGAVRGVIVDHASHATVLGHGNLAWSADWPGAARRALANAIGERSSTPPIVGFLQGAAGDTSTRFVRREQTPGEVARIGERFAEQAAALVPSADSTVGDEQPSVAFRRRRVTLQTRILPAAAVLAEHVVREERAWREVEAGAGAGSPLERVARTRYEGALAASTFAKAGLPPAVDLPISIAVVGADAWVHMPVELFASFAHEIRARSPFGQTRVIGYADGYFGYVADADAHRTQTYEAASSLFDLAGSRRLVDAAVGFLDRTHRELNDPSAARAPQPKEGSCRSS